MLSAEVVRTFAIKISINPGECKLALILKHMAGVILSGLGSIFGGLAAGTGAIGSVVSANQSWKRQKRAMDYQHKLAIEAYERELADSRDYSAIVEAANKAGINPLVALGQSAGGGSISATSVPGEDSLPSTVANAGASISSAINGMTNGAMLLKEQIRGAELDNDAQEIDNELKGLDLEREKREAEDHPKEIEHRRDMREFEKRRAKAEAELAEYNSSIKKIDADNYQDVFDKQQSILDEQYKILQQQYDKGEIDKKYYESEKIWIFINNFVDVVYKAKQMQVFDDQIKHNAFLRDLFTNKDNREERTFLTSVKEFILNFAKSNAEFEKTLQETIRHNQAVEDETKRHNQADEQLEMYKLVLGALGSY